MKQKGNSAMINLFLSMMVGGLRPKGSEPKAKKNKLGLSIFEIEQMKTMTPKEKKIFLKDKR